MPLIKSGSKEAVSSNIREMIHAGHPKDQAVAAALSTARKYARKAEGGADLEAPPPDPNRIYIPRDTEARPPRPEEFGQTPSYEQPRRGPFDRALAGIRHAYTHGGEFGISGENLRKYPALLPFQPLMAGVDAGFRTIDAGIKGAAGLAGGVAGDFGGQAQGDRMERDIGAMGQVAMPELASPLGIHSIPAAARKAGKAMDAVTPDPNTLAAAPAVAPKAKEYFHPYDLDPSEVKGAKQIGQQKGSNPGGLYELPSGEPVYIKTPQTHEHTYNEKLAAELYKAAGVPVADVKMTKFKGKPSIASPIVPGNVLNTFHPDEWGAVKGIKENYPVDLWLGNYDFVGTGKDNMIVDHMNNAWRIDTGGALRFRAQGKLKGPEMWGPNVEHFDLNKSPDIADVVPNLNDASMKPAAQRVADITDEQIGALVDKYGPLTKGEKPKLVDTLIKRRDAIAEMYGVKKGGSSEPSGGSGMPADMDAFFANMEKEMLGEPASPQKKYTQDFDLNAGMEPYKPNFLEKASEKFDNFLQPAADKIENVIDFAKNKIFGKNPVHHNFEYIPIEDVIDNPLLLKPKAEQLSVKFKNDPFEIEKHLKFVEQGYGSKVANDLLSHMPDHILNAAPFNKKAPKKDGEVLHSQASNNPDMLKPMADQIAKQMNYDPAKIANELVKLAKSYGPDYADKIGMKLPESVRHDVGHHLDQLDYEAQQAKQFEQKPWEHEEFAYDDDMAPKMDEGYFTENQHETHYGKPILTYKPEQVKKWAQIEPLPAIHSKDVGYYRNLIKHASEPGNVIQRINNFEDWVPPVQAKLEVPRTPLISAEKLRGLLFNPNFPLYKGGEYEHSLMYPKEIMDPQSKFQENAFFLADQKSPAAGYGTVGLPYVLRAKNAVEVYLPHLTGELYEAKHNPTSSSEMEAYRAQKFGSPYSGTIFNKLIKAGHAEGLDLIIVHGVDDLGAHNHTQYMVLNTKGNVRGLRAKFDPAHIHPSSPQSRNPLAGIVGGTPFVYGILKGQQDKDEKMARGGKTKFKPYSSIHIKDRKLPQTVIRPSKTVKALRTAKKLASGGKADDTPQEHHFINFKKGGMIDSDIPGRTDEIPMKVTSGAYVLPADIPSALGQGNTMAGKSILDNMFGGDQNAEMADGGEVDDHVPIIAAGGEYIIHPNKVKEIGQGDMKKGHKVLDKFVLHTRAEHIKTLKGLKPPK